MRIEREQTAALVVDYQEKLIPVMYGRETLIRNSVTLLKGLAELEVPATVTQQYTKGLGKTVPEIVSAVQTEEYIEKIQFGAYKNAASWIGSKRFVIICGVEAHICVLQTVIDLKEAGYIPVLVADCISSRKAYQVRMAVERARAEGAVVTTCEAILFELLKEAGTPVSKRIQKLIR